jgi:hypothetical protein
MNVVQQFLQQLGDKPLVDMTDARILSPSRLPISPSEPKRLSYIRRVNRRAPRRTKLNTVCNSFCNSDSDDPDPARFSWLAKDSVRSVLRSLALAGSAREWTV